MSKTALVTGASRGIGRAVALKLAGEGYNLYLTSKNSKEALIEVAAECEKLGVWARQVVCDMGSPAHVQELFSRIDKLDVLVNNAGISYVGLLQDMSIEQWQEVINVNLSGYFYTSKYAIPKMLQAGQGCIINVSSVWGKVGASMEVAYSASKGGVNAMTRGLAKELAPSHIRVNAVACGMIDTQMNACFSAEDKQMVREEIPADRFGTPEEVAEFIYTLIQSPEYLTGQVISLDGGWQ